MNTGSLGRGDVSCLAVKEQVGEWGPHQGGTGRRHLLEFGGSQSHAVNQHQFAHEQVVVDENVKLSTARFVHAFGNVDEPRIEGTACVPVLDVVPDVIRGQFRDLGVNLVPSEVVVLNVSRQHRRVTLVRVARASLRSGGSTDDGFHLDVFHRLRFHVPVRAGVHEHLRFRHLFAVIGVVSPFVAVVVASPSVALVFGEVGRHVPEGCLVVMEVVVQIDEPGVNGAVSFQHGHVGQLNVRGHRIAPDRFDHPVFHQNMAFVDDIGFTGHGHNTALQHVCTAVDIVGHSVATNHVLGDAIRCTLSPAGRWRRDLADGPVDVFHVRRVPPRVFCGVGERVDNVPAGVGDDRSIVVPVIQFNTGTCTEDDDVGVRLNRGVPGESAGSGTPVGQVVENPI